MKIRKQEDIKNTHDITKEDLNQAVSTLGAFLSVREVFYRIANDLEVNIYFINLLPILKRCLLPVFECRFALIN